MTMHGSVSHSREEETPEAKARWFRSLPMSERMELLCEFTDLALSVNPSLQDRKHAERVAGRIQVFTLEDLVRSKRAAGRVVDLEDVRLLEQPNPTDTDPDAEA